MSMRRALVCAPLPPEFDRESGSKRVFDAIAFLQEAGWSVSFVAENGSGGERYERLLNRRGVATYRGFGRRTEQLFEGGQFDLAIFAFWYLAERNGILFIGNFRHPPNVEAAEYLCDKIVPLLDDEFLKRQPLYIVGNGLTPPICKSKLGPLRSGVKIVGWVPSVVPYLERCRI